MPPYDPMHPNRHCHSHHLLHPTCSETMSCFPFPGQVHGASPGLLLRKFSSGKTRTRKFLQCFHPRKTRTRKFSHIFSSGENTHSKGFHPKYFISSSLHPYNPYFFHPKYFILHPFIPYNPYFFHPNKIFNT